jgi:hypothetical protein
VPEVLGTHDRPRDAPSGTSPGVVQRDDLLVHGVYETPDDLVSPAEAPSRVPVAAQAVHGETRHPACLEESRAVADPLAERRVDGTNADRVAG